ncbi:DD3-3-like [Brachionus plicatilis]|uniref:DD3-3-like n=1 Tax=Brachionus plicatilis TaxID=10195 RepID=A0A3M7SU31_BRAPC|nr:DD3-3-like [Brachionus plicatilis]
MNLSLLIVISSLCCPVFSDIYLHNPRGSNNRLNEKSATRANTNRVFDSQNNQRGGYNVGDSGSTPFTTESDQYQMKYFQSGANSLSVLNIEWTDQHGCGSDDQDHSSKQNCALVLQYMCQSRDQDDNNLDRIRDGLNTNSQQFTQMVQDTFDQNSQRKQTDVKMDRALHEPWQYYDNCYYRQRNMGLFTADQVLNKNNKGYGSAVHTRQNPNGARSGYECPEERDYFPYWHPSPWKDIAILTSDYGMCDYYQAESFNQKSKFLCIQFYDDNRQKHWSKWNNKNECEQNGGKWTEFFNYLEKATQYRDEKSCNSKPNQKWALAYDAKSINEKECLVILAKPECHKAEWTRSNHLGNTLDGKAPSYNWILPHFSSNKAQKCVFRIRYNISTDDYEPTLDSKSNGIKSPIKTNPQVNMGESSNQVLKLAVNTAQYGRVFQDRSHSFILLPRPAQISGAKIYNLNVRGKRGNIVQVYPGVEYDFVPNDLSVKTNELVHVQWTGSNTHNNAQPAGDGQAGADGQGQEGTDRNNFVQIFSLNDNYPVPIEKADIWKDVEAVDFLDESVKIKSSEGEDLALYLASSGYYKCLKKENCEEDYSKKRKLDENLNNGPASCPGVLIKFKKANKVYYYMSTRNNNFSNRSQKGTIRVVN